MSIIKFVGNYNKNKHSPVFQCIQYKTESMPDVKKIEKLSGNLMTHMASNN